MTRTHFHRRGSSSVTVLLALPVLFASMAISLEVANVYQVRHEAQVAADATTQAAIQDFDFTNAGVVAAVQTAAEVAALNGFTLTPNQVAFGTWDPAARRFWPSADPGRVHAMQVELGKRNVGFGLAALAFGSGPLDVAAASTAAILVRGHTGALTPSSTCDPTDPTCVVATDPACTPAPDPQDGCEDEGSSDDDHHSSDDGRDTGDDGHDDDDHHSGDDDHASQDDGTSGDGCDRHGDDHDSSDSDEDRNDHDGGDDHDSGDDHDANDDHNSGDDEPCGRASDHHVLQVHDDEGSDRDETDDDSNSEDIDYHESRHDRQVGIQYYSVVE